MSPRSPGRGPAGLDPTGVVALDLEILAEQASALGRAGRLVAERLAALEACAGPDDPRRDLLGAAAEAVWAYFVQREAIGLRRHDDAVREYRIPPEVLARLGASGAARSPDDHPRSCDRG